MHARGSGAHGVFQVYGSMADEHLDHTRGWTRELWPQSLGVSAQLPPEEQQHVTSMAQRGGSIASVSAAETVWPSRSPEVTVLRAITMAQALYFVVTGLWGNAHRSSFEKITGPKQDYWLVRTVGALVLVNGLVIGYGTLRGREPRGDLVALATASAASLGAIEAYQATRRRISLIYLADGIIEGVFVVLTLIGWRRARRIEHDDSHASLKAK